MRVVPLALLVAVVAGSGACGGGGGATGAPPAPSSSTPRTTTTPVVPTGPAPSGGKRIVVIYMENHGYGAIEGNPCCPYETELARQGILFTRFYGVAYPSRPNYLAFGGGSTFGQAGIDDPLPSIAGESLFHQLSASSIDWRAWAENYPGRPGHCSLEPTANLYAMRHVAPLLFADVTQTRLCDNVSGVEPRVVPAGRLRCWEHSSSGAGTSSAQKSCCATLCGDSGRHRRAASSSRRSVSSRRRSSAQAS